MSIDVDAGTSYEDCMAFTKKIYENMPERFATYLERAADMAVDLAKSNLQNNGNVSRGDLLASIRILEIKDNGMTVIWGSDLVQSIYIEKGRGPVDAKNAKALTWIDKESGKRVFATHVGPYEPHPFIEPAALEVAYQFPGMITQAEQQFLEDALK